MDDIDDRLWIAINNMVEAAIPMVLATENWQEAARNIVVHFHRHNRLAREWRRKRDQRHAQSWLDTRRTSRRSN